MFVAKNSHDEIPYGKHYYTVYFVFTDTDILSMLCYLIIPSLILLPFFRIMVYRHHSRSDESRKRRNLNRNKRKARRRLLECADNGNMEYTVKWLAKNAGK